MSLHQFQNLAHHILHELLAPETWLNRHDERCVDVINVRQHVLYRGHWLNPKTYLKMKDNETDKGMFSC